MEAKTKNIIFWAGVSLVAVVGGYFIYKKYIKTSQEPNEEDIDRTQEPVKVEGSVLDSIHKTLDTIKTQTGSEPKQYFVAVRDEGTPVLSQINPSKLTYTAKKYNRVGIWMGEVDVDGTKFYKAMFVSSLTPSVVYVQKSNSFLVPFTK